MKKTTKKLNKANVAVKKVIQHRDHGNTAKNEYVLFLKGKGFANLDGLAGDMPIFNPTFDFDLDKATKITKVEANKWAKVFYGGSGKFIDKLRVCPQF